MAVVGDPVGNLVAALDLPVSARVVSSRQIGVGQAAVIEYQVGPTVTSHRPPTTACSLTHPAASHQSPSPPRSTTTTSRW